MVFLVVGLLIVADFVDGVKEEKNGGDYGCGGVHDTCDLTSQVLGDATIEQR